MVGEFFAAKMAGAATDGVISYAISRFGMAHLLSRRLTYGFNAPWRYCGESDEAGELQHRRSVRDRFGRRSANDLPNAGTPPPPCLDGGYHCAMGGRAAGDRRTTPGRCAELPARRCGLARSDRPARQSDGDRIELCRSRGRNGCAEARTSDLVQQDGKQRACALRTDQAASRVERRRLRGGTCLHYRDG